MPYRIRISNNNEDCISKVFTQKEQADSMMSLMKWICKNEPEKYAAYLTNEDGKIIDKTDNCSVAIEEAYRKNMTCLREANYPNLLAEAVEDTLEFLVEFDYPFPEHKYLADGWADWLDEVRRGVSDIFEDAECLRDYLRNAVQTNKKLHLDEEDPMATYENELYERLTKYLGKCFKGDIQP